MSRHDTTTPEGMAKRTAELVHDYARGKNWRALTRLIGGSPRYDLQDHSDADAGEAPKGAEWN
jgi:hypothetical protein